MNDTDVRIVVDNDVISYFWLDIETGRSEAARKVRTYTSIWYAPDLWKSEFLNVLRKYMNNGSLSLAEAIILARNADEDLRDFTLPVDSRSVLQLVAQTQHSAYDCEYVALAQRLDIPLVTGDKHLSALFPDTAILLEDYVRR